MRKRLALRYAVLQDQLNRIFSHCQSLTLIAAISDNFGKCRHPNSESAFLFGLKHNRKGFHALILAFKLALKQ